jgi:hypothetical protein
MMTAWSEDVARFADAIRGWVELDAEMAGPMKYPLATALDIYRNNWRGNLHGALAGAYPVVQALVGAEFFRLMARAFIAAHPSRSGNLHRYGAEFGDLIAGFAPAGDLPYLADVARLEWACHLAYFAPDAEALDLSRLARMSPGDFAMLRLLLHPGCRVVRSDYPVASIWQAHQPGMPQDFRIDLDTGGETALVCRHHDEAGVHALSPAEAHWLEHIAAGAPLGAAVAATLAGHPDFDLQALLARLVALDALIDLEPTTSPGEGQ